RGFQVNKKFGTEVYRVAMSTTSTPWRVLPRRPETQLGVWQTCEAIAAPIGSRGRGRAVRSPLTQATRVRRLVGLDSEAKKGRNMLMPTAAALLDRIGRPRDLSLRTARPEPLGRLPTGLAVLDEALGGGLPRGRIAELAGAPSTGRTGLACAIAAAATRAGETIAWVDPQDALEPEAAAAAGIALARLLW